MPTAAEVFNNPKFQALSPAEKIAVLGRIDPNFAKLSPQDQQALVARAAPTGFQEAAPQAEQYSSPHVEAAGQFLKGVGETINPVNWYQGMKAGMQSKDPNDVMLASLARGYGGPPAEAIARTMVIPMVNAIGTAGDWYQKAARGKIPNAYEQALSVAPEALGQGTGQAMLMREPIENLARISPVQRLAKMAGTEVPPVPVRPGPLLGTMTRARAALDQIETAHANTPVDAVPAFKIALRAYQASQRGYTLPKPIADFLDHMKQQPLDLQAARDFSKSLGEKIPWDQPGAKTMNGFMKDMRGALEEETATALRNDPRAGPAVADQYLKAKLEYGRGAKFIEGGKQSGRAVGGYLGYELGRKFLHSPTEGLIAGGLLGRRFVGPLTGGIAKQWVDPSVLAGTLSKTAEASSAVRKAATPFAGFTAPSSQPPQDEGQ